MKSPGYNLSLWHATQANKYYSEKCKLGNSEVYMLRPVPSLGKNNLTVLKILSYIRHRMTRMSFQIYFLTKCQLSDQIDAIYIQSEYAEVI